MSDKDRQRFAPSQLTLNEGVSKRTAATERELQGMLVGWLRTLDIEVLWHRTDKRSAATVGWPDITFAVAGRAIAWEVKLPGQSPTREQGLMHGRMKGNGWIVEVVHSMDEAIRIMRELYSAAHDVLQKEAWLHKQR